jgi:hypothetical protein
MRRGLLLAFAAVVALILCIVVPGISTTTATGASANGSSNIRLWVSIGVSFIILCAGLFIILSKRYAADDKNWAFGAIGTVVGFWLPTAATAAAT